MFSEVSAKFLKRVLVKKLEKLSRKFYGKVAALFLQTTFDLVTLTIFLIGFGVGISIFTTGLIYSIARVKASSVTEILSSELYDESTSERLFDEVKVLCMVMTNPESHKTKAIHVKNTWGKRCNKLLFITSQDDPELDTIVVDVNESRDGLRQKTKEAFLYAYDNLFEEFDWFLKADDDSFVIIENLRYLLSQYRTKTSLLLGHRFWNMIKHVDPEGYMAGSAYILSKKALKKFSRIIRKNPTKFFYPEGAGEDLHMGKTLAHSAIFADCRDEKLQRRFYPMEIPPFKSSPEWYTAISYYNVSQEGLNCCSDVPVAFHYVSNSSMYKYELLIYNVDPFGVDVSARRQLPRKLQLHEIVAASDAKSFSTNAFHHKDFHGIDSDEVF